MRQIRKSRGSILLGQSGVALADILANSVAVIIILITVTLNIQKQQAEREIDQNADMNAVLARQLATTVVFNDLPSSPPAQLHDYHSCQIPHDCNPMLFPIVELHNGFIRIFNTDTYIHHRELRMQDNAFDRYIRTLNASERANIRIDVFHVDEYYLALGILQEHQIRPRHWHFLGEKATALQGNSLQDGGKKGSKQKDDHAANRAAGRVDGRGRAPSGTRAEQTRMLEGTQMGSAQTLQSLDYGTLLPSDSQPGEASDYSPTGGLSEQPQPQKTPSTLFEALVGMMSGRYGQQQGSGNSQRRSMRLHVPNVEGQQQGSDHRQQGKRITLERDDYQIVVLSYVLKLLELAREQRSFDLPQAREWLDHFIQNKDSLRQQPMGGLVQRIADQLNDLSSSTSGIRIEQSAEIKENRLRIPVNTPNPATVLQLAQSAPWLERLRSEQTIRPSMLLRLYPTLFLGEVLDFPEKYTIIMHPSEHLTEIESPWKAVAVVNPQLTDISLGFVNASVTEDSIVIHSGANQLRLNTFPISNPLLNDEQENSLFEPLVWVAVLGVLLLFLSRYRSIRLKTADAL